MTRHVSHRSDHAGFTLMEVMIATAIVALITGLTWSAFSLTARGKTSAESIMDRYHQIRLAMNRMTREISMSYLSKNDKFGAVVPRTMFSAERKGRSDSLTFSALAHTRLRANVKECDQSLITYYLDSDPKNRSQLNLMRRETRRLGVEHPGEDGPAYVMLENVKKLEFEYFDPVREEWIKTWNTRAADGQPDRLPETIRIRLTLDDEKDEETTIQTATRTYLKDPLWFTAAAR